MSVEYQKLQNIVKKKEKGDGRKTKIFEIIQRQREDRESREIKGNQKMMKDGPDYITTTVCLPRKII